jgi:hypothetical protein
MVRNISLVSRSVASTSACLMLSWIGASLRHAEARAHVDALGAQRQRRRHAAPVGDAARGDDRNAQLARRDGQQHEAGHVVLARMARALEAVDRHRVDAIAFGRQRMAHRGALVHDLHVVALQRLDEVLRAVARGLDDLDAAVDDGLHVLGVRRRLHRRQDGEVHAEGLVRHRAGARDLVAQVVGRGLGERGEMPRPPAFDTAAASSARPTHCMPPCTIG